MAKGKYHDWIHPEGLVLLEGWARDGLTDELIAEKAGIGVRTLYEWQVRYPQISQALKSGKEVVDRKVESALLRRALGYQYEEVTKEVVTVTDEERGPIKVMVETKRVTKEVHPDVTAQIFWLKNRKPEKWRDKQDINHQLNMNNPFSDMTTDELRKLIRDG